MFENKKEMLKYLAKWFKEKMGFEGEVRFSVCYGLKTRNNRPAWDVDCTQPYGVFFVFNDNGDVEDNYGHFGGSGNQLYDAEGNAK